MVIRNQIFPSGNIIILDSLSLRFGLEILTSRGQYTLWHQAMNSLENHSMIYVARGARTHVYYAVVTRAGIRPQFEITKYREIYFLSITSPLLQQNSWRKYPHLILDIVLVSPYSISLSNLVAWRSGRVVAAFAECKHRNRNMEATYQIQNLDSESILNRGLREKRTRTFEEYISRIRTNYEFSFRYNKSRYEKSILD